MIRMDRTIVRLVILPKTLFASTSLSAPRNLDISEDPPTPMAMPIADIRKVIVTDVNKYKKHQKPGNNEPGGIIEKDMPLHVSNVAFYDPSSKKGIRVGYAFNKDGKKMRINKKSGKEI